MGIIFCTVLDIRIEMRPNSMHTNFKRILCPLDLGLDRFFAVNYTSCMMYHTSESVPSRNFPKERWAWERWNLQFANSVREVKTWGEINNLLAELQNERDMPRLASRSTCCTICTIQMGIASTGLTPIVIKLTQSPNCSLHGPRIRLAQVLSTVLEIGATVPGEPEH